MLQIKIKYKVYLDLQFLLQDKIQIYKIKIMIILNLQIKHNIIFLNIEQENLINNII